MVDLWRALVLGVVEGATEFIPVSSTGHLIIVGHLLNFTGERANLFEIVIQLGAILGVVWHYRAMLWRTMRDASRESPGSSGARWLLLTLAVAFLPAAVVGLASHHWITAHLFRPDTVAWALLAGGIAILLVERLRPLPTHTDPTALPIRVALGVGIAQILSLFPGVSRSAATIMGGLVCGVARPAAAEFSFLLAIPVMFAATGLSLHSDWNMLHVEDAPLFAVGLISAFLTALVAIRLLLRLVSRDSFAVFAWYRIMLGALLILALHFRVMET